MLNQPAVQGFSLRNNPAYLRSHPPPQPSATAAAPAAAAPAADAAPQPTAPSPLDMGAMMSTLLKETRENSSKLDKVEHAQKQQSNMMERSFVELKLHLRDTDMRVDSVQAQHAQLTEEVRVLHSKLAALEQERANGSAPMSAAPEAGSSLELRWVLEGSADAAPQKALQGTLVVLPERGQRPSKEEAARQLGVQEEALTSRGKVLHVHAGNPKQAQSLLNKHRAAAPPATGNKLLVLKARTALQQMRHKVLVRLEREVEKQARGVRAFIAQDSLDLLLSWQDPKLALFEGAPHTVYPTWKHLLWCPMRKGFTYSPALHCLEHVGLYVQQALAMAGLGRPPNTTDTSPPSTPAPAATAAAAAAEPSNSAAAAVAQPPASTPTPTAVPQPAGSAAGNKHDRDAGKTGFTPGPKQIRGGEQPPEQRADGGKSREERRSVNVKRSEGNRSGDVDMGSAE